jgi:REP element-mobilizing transposase RayT
MKRFALLRYAPAGRNERRNVTLWQRGAYDMNIWSDKKRLEKLNYMHANPVKRGLVSQPGDCVCD